MPGRIVGDADKVVCAVELQCVRDFSWSRNRGRRAKISSYSSGDEFVSCGTGRLIKRPPRKDPLGRLHASLLRPCRRREKGRENREQLGSTPYFAEKLQRSPRRLARDSLALFARPACRIFHPPTNRRQQLSTESTEIFGSLSGMSKPKFSEAPDFGGFRAFRCGDMEADGADAEIICGVLGTAPRLNDTEASNEVLCIYNGWLKISAASTRTARSGLRAFPMAASISR
jgi:hypothetical protein